MSETAVVPEVLGEVPPTARLVHLCLAEADEPRSVEEISEWTVAPKRSVRKGLADLEDIDAAERVTDPRTPNRVYWRTDVPAEIVDSSRS